MTTQNNTANQNITKIGLVILSVMIPLVGYILYFTKKDEEPEPARNYLVSALAGSALGILLII